MHHHHHQQQQHNGAINAGALAAHIATAVRASCNVLVEAYVFPLCLPPASTMKAMLQSLRVPRDCDSFCARHCGTSKYESWE
eukprot:5885018-Amphidinium_carterae.1